MIFVDKPPPPKELRKGCSLIDCYCSSFDKNPGAYKYGDKRFKFDDGIYQNVKPILLEAQFNKCCYCESEIESTTFGDVEHYRPKAYSQQSERDPKINPGYYWLVYDWCNLFVSCEKCNRSHKRNFFPLWNPNSRARSHHDDLTKEKPLILNPGECRDIRKHITFHGELAKGITKEGKTTVDVVGLNRKPLQEARLEKLNELRQSREAIRIIRVLTGGEMTDSNSIAVFQNFIRAAVKREAKFSAMASVYLEQHQQT